MKILIKRIPLEGEELEGTDPASVLELESEDVRFEEDIRYKILAQPQGNSLLVTGKLETAATLRCGRCLQEFQQPLTVKEFTVLQELHGEDVVDLTPNVREDIILELPQRALCSEDCKGLCTVCGKDLNTGSCDCQKSQGDLRWQSLDQIKLK